MKWCRILGLLTVAGLAQTGSASASAKLASSKKPAVTKGRKGKNSRSAHATSPSYQLHPDPERYAEIQRALADRGYFKGEPNGEWKDDSIDALKRFQADQKLPDDGKISALTLTGLGLGPRHDGSTAVTVPLQTTPSDPSVSGSTVGPAASPPKR